MRNVAGAIQLSFLLAVGGGAALANSNSGADKPSSTSSQTPGSSGSQANGPARVGVVEEEVTSAPLTVERIDKKNGNLVVRAADGTQTTLDVPLGTPGFDSLKKGDRIQIDYFAAEAIEGGQPANGANQAGSNSNHGANQASGASSGANSGKVRNIRKVGNGKSGHSGNTGATGSSGANSGSDQGNR